MAGAEEKVDSLSYREAIGSCEAALRDAGIADAAVDAWLLFAAVTQMDRAQYYLHMNEPMPQDRLVAYQTLAAERGRRIPLQYVLGETEFMGLPFRVTPDVLIPRQDTEILVEEALKILRPGMQVLDLCTGSGCIAVSLAKLGPVEDAVCPEWESVGESTDAEFVKQSSDIVDTGYPDRNKAGGSVDAEFGKSKQLRVTASDISEAALAVSRENARLNGVQIAFVQSDLFLNIEGTFDLIVSNPPYIPEDVIDGLEPEVAEHEPHGALDGGADGLDFYRRIIADAAAHLKPGGWILFEIGCEQGEAVMEMLREAGYKEISCKQDLAHLDRVVMGRQL